MYAKLRKDLIDRGEIPQMYNALGFIRKDFWNKYNYGDFFDCWQPECLDYEELNLVICVDTRLYLCNSIDFEFFYEKE